MGMRTGRRALLGAVGAGLVGRAWAQGRGAQGEDGQGGGAQGGTAPVDAAPWPRQPVRIIVPAAGGGSSDPLARLCAQEFTQRFGQPFVVENRSGASGNVGMVAAARAPADGHTLLFGWAGPLATNLALYPNPGFQSQRDFEPIALLGAISNTLIVGRDSPLRTLADYVALAKARPGEVTYGSTGNGSSMHLAGTVLAQASGTQLAHVPYTSAAAATADLLAGRLDAMFLGAPGTVPLLQGGQVRVLAVLAEQRVEVLPDSPTAAEQGYPAVVMGTWFAWLAPRGTPAPVVAALNGAVNELLRGPLRERLRQQGLEITERFSGGPPEKLRRLLADEIERHAALVRSAGLRMD
ncbi:tripartite tricarboxylate transporter substrate binding protein [Roseomonas sp. NAR14]|uniref:Tripartite tricarboxylate transporter substrate binding protein n=1 Tax=Roseomonas acroporae TaxID=2937791 RepID=A0A9X2BTX8_9PROT|nr:tripartite tricarboxylate transporter substrate binding protein [Roseomonas acroporae]MCK8784797.1 tripartite tricarboxylate transporter substrate binding protein [Roseomonas acroporae]